MHYFHAFLALLLVGNMSLWSVESAPPEDNGLSERLKFAQQHHDFKMCCLKIHEQEFMRLAQNGQAPQSLLITCSDSRVMPSLIFGLKVGDMFEIRNAGNFVPEYDPQIDWDGIAASIQYGIEALNITDIIVCGHSHCGAIQGLYKDLKKEMPLVSKWLKFGQPAKDLVMANGDKGLTNAQKYALTEKVSVLFQLEHLATYPFIKKRLEEKKLFLHGWYVDIASGEVSYYDTTTMQFRPLVSLLR